MATDSSKTRKTSPAAKGIDAITLLTADHRAVKAMFKQYAALMEDGSPKEKLALVRQICTALTLHAQLEEELFYPAVREAIDEDDLMDEADVEHAGAKAAIAKLEGAHPGDDHYDAQVTVLGELIDHHVKEEEKEMFPKARKAIDTRAVGAALKERKEELEAMAAPSARASAPSARASAPSARASAPPA